MKNHICPSRKNTPWDDSDDTSPLQSFIKNKYQWNYKNKHPKLTDTNETQLFNSIKIETCPSCGESNVVKFGKTNNGVQRFKCNKCRSSFTPVTGTIFENHKISISEWIEFCLDIFNYGSINLTSKVNKNGINTSIYWLHKLFLLLDNYQDNIELKGKVFIDETFYSVIYSERTKKDGKFLRGLSHNQYCIGIGCDSTHVIAILEGMGKTSSEKTKETFKTHIKYGSALIHDDEKGHKELVKELNLDSKSYNSKELKKLSDKDNPLNKINRQCDLLKKFLYSHGGFNRNDLQNYLNLFSFMNSSPKNKLKKVEILLNLALTTRVSLKYRDCFKPNTDNDLSTLCK